MSYGRDLRDVHRQARVYGGRRLRGKARQSPGPADLQVQFCGQRTTARILGLAVPDKLLALADEVIE